MSDAMRYRALGRSGLRVADVALGTMTFSDPSHRNGADRPSPGADWSWCATVADARAIVDRYLAAGGNLLDTADIYAAGSSEPLVGECIASVRDSIVLATKYGLSRRDGDVGAGGSGRRSMIAAVERSLRRLATDRIDLLWLHAWDGITPAEEIASTVDALVRSGKVRYWGISDTPAWFVATLVQWTTDHARTPPIALQLRYSVLDRAAEHELLPMARWFGLGVVAFGVLGGGALTGKYLGEGRAPGGRRGDVATWREGERSVAAAVVEVAASVGCTPAQLALAWARARGVVPVIGARTPAQLDDTLAGLDVVLDAEVIAGLDALASPPRPFPHDVTAAIADQLRGGSRADRFDAPPWAAF